MINLKLPMILTTATENSRKFNNWLLQIVMNYSNTTERSSKRKSLSNYGHSLLEPMRWCQARLPKHPFLPSFMPLLQNWRRFPIIHWVHTSNLFFCFSKTPSHSSHSIYPTALALWTYYILPTSVSFNPHQFLRSWLRKQVTQLLSASNFHQRGTGL